jgi:hypothetical protein
MQFRTLDEAEAETFRQYIRLNYTPFSPISGVWHPVSQAECVRINTEAATFVVDNRDV